VRGWSLLSIRSENLRNESPARAGMVPSTAACVYRNVWLPARAGIVPPFAALGSSPHRLPRMSGDGPVGTHGRRLDEQAPSHMRGDGPTLQATGFIPEIAPPHGGMVLVLLG
jgi:hypothetical protein